MRYLTIDQKALALALLMFGAMPQAGKADELPWGVHPGECYRSGLTSTACAPPAPPRYFNRVERDQMKRVRSHR